MWGTPPPHPCLRQADSCTLPACRARRWGGRWGPRVDDCAPEETGAAQSFTPGPGGVRFLSVTRAQGPGVSASGRGQETRVP